MSDDDNIDTDDTIELPEAPPAEAFRAVSDLIALISNASACGTRLISLRQHHSRIRNAAKKLAADKAAFQEEMAKERAAIAEEKAAATRRVLTAQEAERGLAERHERYAEMARKWDGLKLPGEPYELFGSISRPQPFSGYQKAKHYAEHGVLPTHPDAPVPNEREAEAEQPTVVRRGPSDAGDWPANVTLTRSPEKPEPALIRVRPNNRKGAAAS
jgi:hypothetical protein